MTRPGYRRESLGRMAVFLLPSLKLKQRGPDGLAVEDRIHRFLIGNFAGEQSIYLETGEDAWLIYPHDD